MAKNRVSFATYPQDYYTGSTCRVYFGSTYVDDIATISYQTSHNKLPLYGYADHQFRAVAKGQFIVRGNFTIAFKETGYLPLIMNLIKKEKSGMKLNGKKSIKDTYINYISQGYTVEEALDELVANNLTNPNETSNISDFEDLAEVMEDTIWGKKESVGVYGNRIPRSDELDYFKYTVDKNEGTDIDVEGFDILLTFGNYTEGDDNLEHTVISINDVHITNESMVVTTTGDPIGLSFEFFARGLNERISTSYDTKQGEAAKEVEKPVTPKEVADEKVDDLIKADITQNSDRNVPVSDFKFYDPKWNTAVEVKPNNNEINISNNDVNDINDIPDNSEYKPTYVQIQSVYKPIVKETTQERIIEPQVDRIIIKVSGNPENKFKIGKQEAKKQGVLLVGDTTKGTMKGNRFYNSGFYAEYEVISDKLIIDIKTYPRGVTKSYVKKTVEDNLKKIFN